MLPEVVGAGAKLDASAGAGLGAFSFFLAGFGGGGGGGVETGGADWETDGGGAGGVGFGFGLAGAGAGGGWVTVEGGVDVTDSAFICCIFCSSAARARICASLSARSRSGEEIMAVTQANERHRKICIKHLNTKFSGATQHFPLGTRLKTGNGCSLF